MELRHARVACRACRKAVDPSALKAFYRGDDEAQARAVALRVTAQAEGMPIEDYARVLETMQRENPGTVEDVLGALVRRNEFGAADFREEMRRRLVPGDPDRLLEQLTQANRLYEPREGRYRFV